MTMVGEEETRWKLKAPREGNSSRFAFPLTRSPLTIPFASSNSPRILELENELANSRIRYFVALRTWLEPSPSLRPWKRRGREKRAPSLSLYSSLSLFRLALPFICTVNRFQNLRSEKELVRETREREREKKGRKKETKGRNVDFRIKTRASRSSH